MENLISLITQLAKSDDSVLYAELEAELQSLSAEWSGMDPDDLGELILNDVLPDFEELVCGSEDSESVPVSNPKLLSVLAKFAVGIETAVDPDNDGTYLGQLGYCVARNPHCDVETLKVLAESEFGWEDDSTLERIAAHPNIDPALEEICVESEDADVLWELARNPHTSVPILESLEESTEVSFHARHYANGKVGEAASANLKARN